MTTSSGVRWVGAVAGAAVGLALGVPSASVAQTPEVNPHETFWEAIETLDDAAQEAEPVWRPAADAAAEALDAFRGSPAYPIYEQAWHDADELGDRATDPQTAIDLVVMALSTRP